MGESVRIEKRDRTAIVWIDREESLNALSTEVIDDLDAALDALEADEDTGVIVLTGAGKKAFVAGADIREMADLDEDGARAYSQRGLTRTLEGDREGGLSDLSSAAEIAPDAIYTPLWIAGLSDDFSRLRSLAHSNDWMAAVIRFYLDELSLEELLEEAASEEDKALQTQQLCEAHCFVGLLREQQGRPEAARTHYGAAVATGVQQFVEYHWAQARLQQLED